MNIFFNLIELLLIIIKYDYFLKDIDEFILSPEIDKLELGDLFKKQQNLSSKSITNSFI